MKLVIESPENDLEEFWKIIKGCAKGFEGAMGCECLWDINHPHCPATTIQEVRDMLPKGCEAREIYDRIETYCDLRNGRETKYVQELQMRNMITFYITLRY